MIPAMTNRRWISPPPTFMTNPSSQKAISATIIIQSILPIFFTPSKWYSEFTRKLDFVNCLMNDLSLNGQGMYILEVERLATPSMEDYIEQIYMQLEARGEARVSDVAEALSVLPSSVTKMAQRLDREGYVIYERYRGLELTEKGLTFGKKLVRRHELLEQFLRIIGVEEKNIYQDVEGIEHHLSWNAMDRITDLVEAMKEDDGFVQRLKERQSF